MAKLSQRRTSKKQKVLQRSNPFVSETFVSSGLLAGTPALATDVDRTLVHQKIKYCKIYPEGAMGHFVICDINH
jgi:hypothetical protein